MPDSASPLFNKNVCYATALVWPFVAAPQGGGWAWLGSVRV